MFVWAPLPPAWRERGSMAAVASLIERAHVAVSPGICFGPGGDGHVRIALVEDSPRLLEACARIRHWLA
jgi:alanine-synthesizing transaminase